MSSLMGQHGRFYITGTSITLGCGTRSHALNDQGKLSRPGIGYEVPDADALQNIQYALERRGEKGRTESEANVWKDERAAAGIQLTEDEITAKRRKIEQSVCYGLRPLFAFQRRMVMPKH